MSSKTRTLLCTTFAFLFCISVNVQGQDALLDPPHADSGLLGCLTCHDMMAYSEPNMIPDIGHVPGDIDDTQYNNICWGCHYDGGPAPDAAGHSSMTTSNTYGTWTVECVVCHNQHRQEQDNLLGTSYGMFIKRNINLTKILNNAPPYGSTVAGKSGTRTVTFTGPATFADGDSVIDGICEVCHTETKYHKNDGTGSAHKAGENCTVCHIHDTGFVGGGDHSFLIGDTATSGTPACVTCHGTQFTDSPETAHSGCNVCHITPIDTGSPPILVDSNFPNASGQPDWDNSPPNGSMLVNLAGNGFTLTGGRLRDADGTFIDGTGGDLAFADIKCGYCHAAKPDALDSGDHGAIDHVGLGKATFDAQCAGCHDQGGAGDDAQMMAIHNGSSQGCGTCHASSLGGGPLVDRSGGGVYASESKNYESTNPSGGGCTTCHGNYGSNFATAHTTVDHQSETPADILTASANCTTNCHDGSSAANILANTHDNTCTNCHTNMTTDGRLISATNGDATVHTIDSASTCADCHADYNTSFLVGHDTGVSNVHQSTTGTETLVASANCTTNCHAGATNAYNIANGIHNVSCTNCHTHMQNDGSLRTGTNGDATGHALDGVSSCTDCHGDYNTNFGTAHDVVDHTGMTAMASCTTNCHDGSSAANIISNTHGDTCTNCHTNTTTDGRLKSGTDGDATGGSGNCASCHGAPYDYDTQFQTAHDVKDHSGLGTTAKCDTCHTGNLLTDVRTHGDGAVATCTLCHTNTTTDGRLLNGTTGGTRGAYAAGDATVAAGGDSIRECAECHSTYAGSFNAHQRLTDHDGVGSTANCASCHTGNVITSLLTHKNACAWCHVAALGADGTLRDGTDAGTPEDTTSVGDATGHDITVTSTCADCHTAHNSNFGTGHVVKDHSGLAATATVETAKQSDDCNDCHSGPVADVTLTDEHSDTCVDCHSNTTSDGSLVDGAANSGSYGGTGTNVGNATGHTLGSTSECTNCHTVNYFSNTSQHTSSTHSVAIDGDTSGGSTCDVCHTGHSENWANILARHDLSATTADVCHVCHDSTRETNTIEDGTGGVQKIIRDNVGQATVVSCLDCHSDKSASHGSIDHVGLGKTTFDAQCAGCHDQGGAGDNAQMMAIHNASSQGCGTCHVAPGGGGPLVDRSGGGVYASESKNYESTNPSGGGCATCHGNYGSNFSTAHMTVDHQSEAPADILTASTNCTTTCHDGSSAANILTNTHNGTCTNCHTNTTTDGRLKSATNGDASGHTIDSASNCASCHSAYNTNFGTAHDVVDHRNSVDTADMLAVTASCTTNCHDGSSLANIISVTHSNTCTNCHTNTVSDGTLKSATNGDASGHTPDTASTCADCHTAYNTNFGTAHDVIDHSGLGTIAKCDSCHSGNMLTDVRTHGDGAVSTCTLCHTNTTTDGRLLDGTTGGTRGAFSAGDASGHDITTTSACADCHTLYAGSFNAHQRLTDHDGVGTTASCVSCHTGNVITSLVTHKNACAWCHVAALGADGTLRDGTAAGTPQDTTSVGDATGHDITVTSNCVDCHATRGADFTAHVEKDHRNSADTADMLAVSASCTTNCHDGSSLANIISTTHNNTCTNCHTNTSNDGSLRSATNGDAGSHSLDTASTCASCHGDYNSNFQTAHDAVDHTGMAATASCTTNCHDGSSAANIISNTHGNTCTNCHTNTTTDGRLISGTNGDATGGSGNCVSCHGSPYNYDTQFQTAHDMGDHTGVTGVANCTTTCHDGTTAANIVSNTHGSTCTNCHTNTTTDGRLISGTNGNATGGSGNCASCHSAYNTNFGTAHDVGDHRNSADTTDMLATTTSCTTNCHDGAPLADILGVTHTACTNCHTNTVGDGTLRSGTNGNASGHTIDTASACANCHSAYNTNFQTAHEVKDHSGLVSTATVETTKQSDDCNDCHSGPVADVSAADEHNDTCVDCHSNTTTDGRLVDGSANAGSYGGTGSNVGDATGHTFGGASECIDCHAANYFSNTSQHTSNTHSVAIDGDTAGGTTCSAAGCHQGQSENWANILTRHDLSTTTGDVCHVCHDSTRTANVQAPRTSVQNVITFNAGTANIVSCLECHSDRSVAHGGHSAGDTKVQNTANCSSCHSTPTGNPVTEVHGDNCDTCHVNPAGGGPLHEPWETNYPSGGDCEDCHDNGNVANTVAEKAGIHHDFSWTGKTTANGKAQNGTCVDCHMPDVGQTISARGDINMPANLACNFCHLWWPNNKNYYTSNPDNGYDASGAGSTVNIFSLNWDPNGTTAQTFAGSAALSTHAISKNTTTPISDYGACFDCHGATAFSGSAGTSTSVTPFHGFGPAITGFEPLSGDSGVSNVLIEWYAGPITTGQNQPARNVPFHPGFASFNHLALEVRPVNGTKKFSTDTRKAHDNDWQTWEPSTAITTIKSGEFSIPWDNYNSTISGAPGTSATLNTGGQTGSFTKSTIVPLVPLNLPTSITP